MNEHEKINYVEFPAKDIEATKVFFKSAFDWSFVDYGPEYTAFSNEGLDGGFFQSELTVSTENGSALIVFYSKELDMTLDNLMVLLEPVIMIVMGIAVGLMATAIILPMYSLTSQF